MIHLDWGSIFHFDTPILEIVVRGTVVYLGLFMLLRLVLKRESGGVGITDLLVIVLLADAAQNAMADDYHSVPDGLLLVSTIVFWSYALNWLGFHVKRVEGFVHPKPLPLIKNGHVLRERLREELITEDELMSQLRLHGASRLSDVQQAHMESDGRISVILRGPGNQSEAPEKSLV